MGVRHRAWRRADWLLGRKMLPASTWRTADSRPRRKTPWEWKPEAPRLRTRVIVGRSSNAETTGQWQADSAGAGCPDRQTIDAGKARSSSTSNQNSPSFSSTFRAVSKSAASLTSTPRSICASRRTRPSRTSARDLQPPTVSAYLASLRQPANLSFCIGRGLMQIIIQPPLAAKNIAAQSGYPGLRCTRPTGGDRDVR